MPVHPVTLDIAWLAGRIEDQQEAKGIRVPFEDLLIGATALHLSYSAATSNLRHFRQISACHTPVKVKDYIFHPYQKL